MKRNSNESIRSISKQKIKNRFQILLAVILLIFSLILMQPDIKVLRRKAFLSNSSYKTITNTSFDNFKIKINNNYNKDELRQIKKVEIDLIDGENYDYLNEMVNLETLIINDYSTTNLLDNIDGSVFKNKINIEIYRKDYKQSFTKEKFGFLKDIPYINKLTLGKPLELGSTYNNKIMNAINNSIILNKFKSVSYNIDSKFLESLKNVHNLDLAIDEYFRYTYNDLTFLDSLHLNGGAYDVAIYFSNEDIKNLEKSGVVVTTKDMDELVKVNNQIDNIIKELNIKSNTKDIDKLDIVLSYVLSNAKYDETLNGVTDVSNYNLSKFYKDGFLKGFLNGDSQICGNYASIMNVLLNRVGVNSYLINSPEHIWNTVSIDNKYYYLDATWIDDTILKTSNKEITAEQVFSNKEYSYLKSNFEWYLLEPEIVDEYKLELHDATFIPVDIQDSFNELNIKMSNANIIETRTILGVVKFIVSLIAAVLSFIDMMGSLKYDKKLRKQILELKKPIVKNIYA